MFPPKTLPDVPKLNLTDYVMKLDHRLLRKWLKDLEKVLPVIPSTNGLVLTKDERPLFTFLMNSRGGGLTPEEAYAFVGVLSNLLNIVDAAQSQQADFIRVRKMLEDSLRGLTDVRKDEARKLLQDTSYIFG